MDLSKAIPTLEKLLAISDLMPETLYWFPEESLLLAGATKKMLLLYESDVLQAAEKQLWQKIIEAVNDKLDDKDKIVVLPQDFKNSRFYTSEMLANYDYVVFFGNNAEIHRDFMFAQPYQPTPVGEKGQFLLADSLATILDNPAQKRQLWDGLQKMVGI